MNKIIDYGFVAPKIIKEEEYVLGAVTQRQILQPSGNWREFLPEYEPQFNNAYDSYGCTVWGGQNQLEIIECRLFGIKSNYSERFNYSLANIRPPGTSPQITYENFRKYGLINNDLLPMSATYDEFISPVPCSTLPIGQSWLDKYDLKHEWLWTTNQTKDKRTAVLKDTLKYCPVAVSVTAWFEKDGVYVDNGQPNTHWCLIFGWNDRGWEVFDSYDQSVKILSYDHNIMFAKTMYLFKRITPRIKMAGNWFSDFFGRLFGRSVGGPVCTETGDFTRDLFIGSKGYDVLKLQQFLNENVATLVAKFGAGSRGEETTYFGDITKQAVIKWQRLNGVPTTGYFGPISREKANQKKNMTMANNEKIATVAEEKLGTDFTDDRIVSDDVSCVFALTSILKEVDPETPILINTAQLADYCKNSPKFKRIYEPVRGCIVVGVDNGNARRDIIPMPHAGIYKDDFNIMSNNSQNGLWLANYDRLSWRARYFTKGGYDVQLYQLI